MAGVEEKGGGFFNNVNIVDTDFYSTLYHTAASQRMTGMIAPSKRAVAGVRKKLGLEEAQLNTSIQLLEEWLQAQPHLPHHCEKERLEQVLLRCKGSVSRAKELLDMYYSIKTLVPEVMCDRDPNSKWFQTATSLRTFLPLPNLTEDFDRVTLSVLLDTDSDRYTAMEILKLIFMILDLRMSTDYWDADIIVMDLRNISLAHASKYTPPILKRIELCGKRGMNVRLKAMHLINAPTYVDATVNIAKSFLKPKLASRIHVHRGGLESLHKYISPKILPTEYGGEAGTLQELWDAWISHLLDNRDWFLKQDKLKADESKRPEKRVERSSLFGVEGSFKELTLD